MKSQILASILVTMLIACKQPTSNDDDEGLRAPTIPDLVQPDTEIPDQTTQPDTTRPDEQPNVNPSGDVEYREIGGSQIVVINFDASSATLTMNGAADPNYFPAQASEAPPSNAFVQQVQDISGATHWFNGTHVLILKGDFCEKGKFNGQSTQSMFLGKKSR